MLRSLLTRRFAALRLTPTSSSPAILPSAASTSHYQQHLLFFSTNGEATAKQKSFPSNLKIDPRSSFAPVDRSSALTAIRVDDDNNNKEEDPEASEQQVLEDKDDDHEADFVWEEPPVTRVIPLPDRLHASVYNFGSLEEEQEEVGTLWLNETVFGCDPIRVDLLKRAVDYHRAKKRGFRKAHSKTISEKRGSTRKMRPQKGQGMARAGHRFAAHWRGGAKAHGPKKETNYGNIKMNKKMRKLAIRNVLSQKLKEQNLIVVNQFHTLPSHKTKVLAQWLEPFGIAGRHGTTALMLDHYWPDKENKQQEDDEAQATTLRGAPINLHVASRNLFKLKIGNQLRDLNVYDVLKHEKLVMTVDALTAVQERLKDE